MIITNNDLNSMPQQVEENKNNIKILANYLKEAYKTSNDLGDSAVSIAISDTNATADTIDGWLISHDGYLYHITSGDGTNLLLEYYTRLKGDTGATGATGSTGATGADGKSIFYTSSNFILNDNVVINRSSILPSDITISVGCMVLDNNYMVGQVVAINGNDITILGLNDLIDDTNILVNKVWSSDKTNKEIEHTFKSTTDATYTDGEYRLNKAYLSGTPTINDLVIYVNSDGLVSKIYRITDADTYAYVLLDLVGNYGGKKMYQHNIKMAYHSGSTYFCARLTILNYSITPLEITQVRDWLNDNGFKFNSYYTNKYYNCTAYDSTADTWYHGVSADKDINTWNFCKLGGASVGVSAQFTSAYFNEFEDTPIEVK